VRGMCRTDDRSGPIANTLHRARLNTCPVLHVRPGKQRLERENIMSRFNPYFYAGNFGKLADEYALEALEHGELDSKNIEEWAYETAHGLDGVIYYYQALSLFTAGYFDNVDDEHARYAAGNTTDGVQLMILNLCCALSYSWHHDRLHEAATKIIANRDYSAAMKIIDAAHN